MDKLGHCSNMEDWTQSLANSDPLSPEPSFSTFLLLHVGFHLVTQVPHLSALRLVPRHRMRHSLVPTRSFAVEVVVRDRALGPRVRSEPLSWTSTRSRGGRRAGQTSNEVNVHGNSRNPHELAEREAGLTFM